MEKIDLVVMYVNEQDQNWKKDYEYYKNIEINSGIQLKEGEQNFGECRVRDWNLFRFFFRGVEKNCPWINKIFLIVQRETQIPDWINRNHKKLRIVLHDEFIPNEFLPTFNNFVIETFLSKIEDLSDNFIIGCDDFFFTNRIEESRFFRNGIPVQECLSKPFRYEDNNYSWQKMTNNSLKLLSKYNDKIMNPYQHLFESRWKSWELEFMKTEDFKTIVDSLRISKFRHNNNILPTVFADIMRLLNITIHDKVYENSYYVGMTSKTCMARYRHADMICLNDTNRANDNYEVCQAKAFLYLNKYLPIKSSFEKEGIENEKLYISHLEKILLNYEKSRPRKHVNL